MARPPVGVPERRDGDLRGARDALAQADRSRTKGLRPAIAALIALCDALAGDLDAAERWVAEARGRSSGPTATSRVHLAAEAILRVRRGDPAGGARLLDQSWGEIERATSADLVRGFRVVWAFAAEQGGPQGAARAAELLAGARPFRPGEYAWLATAWPEMRRYLEDSGFGAVA